MNAISESGEEFVRGTLRKGCLGASSCLPFVTITSAIPVTFATMLEDCAKTQPFTSLGGDTV